MKLLENCCNIPVEEKQSPEKTWIHLTERLLDPLSSLFYSKEFGEGDNGSVYLKGKFSRLNVIMEVSDYHNVWHIVSVHKASQCFYGYTKCTILFFLFFPVNLLQKKIRMEKKQKRGFEQPAGFENC